MLFYFIGMVLCCSNVSRHLIENNDCTSVVTDHFKQHLFSQIATYVIISLAIFNLLKEVSFVESYDISYSFCPLILLFTSTHMSGKFFYVFV